MGCWCALVLLMLAPWQSIAAQPPSRRVIWLVPSVVLADAARAGFGPAQIEVLENDGPVDARALAHALGGSVVVWASERAGGAKLWVFDVERDRIVGTRSLLTTKLDAATAAAIVLSVKSYLVQNSAQPEPADLARQSESQPQPSAANTTEAGSASDRSPISSNARAAHRSSGRLELAAAGGVRAAMRDLAPEVRFGFSALLHTSSVWGLAVELSAGSGFQARGTRVTEPAAALLGVWQMLEAEGWRASLIVGPALHWLSIRVDGAETGAQSAQRLRPHVYAGLRGSWQAQAGWFVAAWVSADIPLITQRYWLGDRLALEARPIAVNAQLAVGWPFQL
jgi:hypothetical protein